MKREVKIEVANKIRALMESEGTNWVKPWASAGRHCNARSGRPYRGINVFLTGMSAAAQGFTSPFWNTYKGWTDMGHQVAKGSRGTEVVLWKPISKINAETGEDDQVWLIRFYNVFNADQLATTFVANAQERAPVEPHEAAEIVIAETGADIQHGGDMAAYSPALDAIRLPNRDDFTSADGYYSTAFHELGHWTGHKSRLDRDLTGYFGNPEYAFEELIAELTSALVCVDTRVTPEPRADHARYLNHWIKGLADQPNAILRAFSAAQKAADYITEADDMALAA